ncbi:hypothetical protein DPMN_071844 [Dreissena polymorpha]|uniref:Uncharacterized protein n=1 Tax=Dreissena polymorpha TaxID=45954 RepID=A0A9D3Z7Q1_DREPO|nr:hypothetical protein DPMN_071844 [Dreissena polymorpha]
MKSFRALYGYNYGHNGWIGDIWSIVCNDITYTKATVSPSQPGVGRKDYNAWIAVSKTVSVETGHCSCPAGMLGHVATYLPLFMLLPERDPIV